VQTLLFVVTFAAAGATTLAIVRRAEVRAAHAEIEEYEDDVTDRLAQRGLTNLIAYNRTHHDAVHDFRLDDAKGRVLAGGFPAPPIPKPMPAKRKFWSSFAASRVGPVLAYTRPEPGGLRLTVGEYLRAREAQDNVILWAVAGLATVVAAIGMMSGVWISRGVLRHVDGMAQSIERYAGGDRAARIERSGQGASDLDDLAGALNRMMDRENRLVEGLRQVSSSIAHDLRRPLAHHNQEIGKALAGPASTAHYRNALIGANERVSEVLETFQALLHIAELEAGAPGLALCPVDLDEIAGKVVDAYAPRAEAEGRLLSYSPSAGGAEVEAEPRILGQALANLIENALTHTPPGTRVQIRVEARGPRIIVSDDGPGVPEAIRGKIFERFFRQDTSRSTSGNGLGLALATAAFGAFGGNLTAEDADPGLRLVAAFDGAQVVGRPVA
jgi:signal transduction histidine kinase